MLCIGSCQFTAWYLKFQIAVEKFRGYKSSGTDRISAELIQSKGKRILSKIHKFC